MKRIALIALLFLASSAFAANGFTQIASCNDQTGALSCTPTFGSNQTAGNSLVVIKQNAVVGYTYGTAPTLTGAICYPLRSGDVDVTQNTSGVFLDSWICPNIPGGTMTGPTITAAPSSNTNFTAFVIEVSGLGAWPRLDYAPSAWPNFVNVGGPPASSLGFGSGNSSSLATNAVNTTSGALLIAYGGNQTSPATTCTAGAGFTIPSGGQVTSTGSIACVEYNLSGSGGSTSAAMTTNTAQDYSFALVSIVPGSTPYSGSGTSPANGYWLQRGAVNAVPSHSASGITEAFASMAVAADGNILMAYEQNTANQGSGPNSAAALRYSSNGGSSWTDYSGSTVGTDCAGHPWFAGCLFSGDGLNADSHWFPGYDGLSVNGSTINYQVTVESSTGNCVHAYLYSATTSTYQTAWTGPVEVDTAACWISPIIYVPGGGVSSSCPSGCMVAIVQENGGTTNLWFSTNGGATWGSSKSVTAGSVLFNQLETYVFWNGGNQLVGIARSSGQPLRTFQTPDMGTTWSGSYTNSTPNVSNLNVTWGLVSPVVLNPNLGDGNISVIFGDRNFGSIRTINASISTLLNSPQSLSQGETMATFTGSNTSCYPTVAQVSGNTYLFAWYAPNANNNGQIYTMQATYIPSTVSIVPQMLARLDNPFLKDEPSIGAAKLADFDGKPLIQVGELFAPHVEYLPAAFDFAGSYGEAHREQAAPRF